MKAGWLALLAALAVTPASVAQPAAEQVALADTPRRSLDLSSGWRFRLGGEDRPVAPQYDDAAWQRVNVPHTWNWIGGYGNARDPRTDSHQGVGWYRLTFPAPARAPGERSFVQFDAVSNIAEVWLNGQRLGEHRGAFSRFRFEATRALRDDAVNVLVVRADNSKREAGSPTADVIPLSGDFFLFGGIYRGVSLVTTSAAHIDLMDHGGPGIYATTRSVADGRAVIDVRTRVVAGRTVTLTVALDDAAGRTVAERSQRVGAGEVASVLEVAQPRLWNGRADPYRYRLRAELSDGRRLLDRVTQPFGIRTFRVDPDQGFFLNGRHLPLHGVSRHQDRLGKGWALTPGDHAEDMALIAELGANTVRMAHYQHADEWFEQADAAGMVVWAELPFVNQVAWTDRAAPAAVVDNAKDQLIELIRQHYNRPGVVTWSVGNEVDIHARGQKWGNWSRALLEDLHRLAKREDPSRPTVFADCCEETMEPLKPGREILTGATDLAGYNRYFGWYYGTPDDLGPALDILHRRYTKTPISVAEYGAGGAISQHSDDPTAMIANFSGRPQPEEYESLILERAWAAIAARRFVWASWVWNMFDFVSNTRSEGDATDLNTKGLMTADRKTRKDGFFFLKANWSDAPVLHLTGRRYVDRAYPVADVRAYSNAGRASLSLNGRDVGTVACPGRICVWSQVRLAAGTNVLVATAEWAGVRMTDEVRWSAPDARAGLAIDAGAPVGGTYGGRRYGSDAFVTGGTVVERKGATGLAATLRQGSFAYGLPLPDRRWTVALELGEGQVGTVVIDGRPVAEVAAGNGGVRRFAVRSTGGRLRIALRGDLSLAALTVSPAR